MSNAVLVITAAILFYAAWTDLKHYVVPNELIVSLMALYLLHAYLAGRLSSVPSHILFALLILGITLFFYSRTLMGGGDVKLLSVAFLWAGIDCALPLAILLLLCTATHAGAARFGWLDVQHAEGDPRARIPFAPSVAAALIGIFMLGCLAAVH